MHLHTINALLWESKTHPLCSHTLQQPVEQRAKRREARRKWNKRVCFRWMVTREIARSERAGCSSSFLSKNTHLGIPRQPIIILFIRHLLLTHNQIPIPLFTSSISSLIPRPAGSTILTRFCPGHWQLLFQKARLAPSWLCAVPLKIDGQPCGFVADTSLCSTSRECFSVLVLMQPAVPDPASRQICKDHHHHHHYHHNTITGRREKMRLIYRPETLVLAVP